MHSAGIALQHFALIHPDLCRRAIVDIDFGGRGGEVDFQIRRILQARGVVRRTQRRQAVEQAACVQREQRAPRQAQKVTAGYRAFHQYFSLMNDHPFYYRRVVVQYSQEVMKEVDADMPNPVIGEHKRGVCRYSYGKGRLANRGEENDVD
ncbi:MAG: hypothetical protein U0694_15375 [Anaerolineae bacterium]